jgi:hypothetical protein
MVNEKRKQFFFKYYREYFRWQQCFLAGINHMLLGFRNDYGIVEYLQPLGVKDIEIRAVDIFIF